jgi:hypothetical protein
MSRTTTRRPTLGVLWLSSTLLFGLGVASSQAQEPMRFFPCGEVRFFGEACAPPTTPVSPVAPEATTPPPAAPEPLFTPETVGPETPPLLLRLLQEPTADNAKAFVEWQHARQARMIEVQGLLRALSRQGPRP